jgi:hypothetical protein
VGYASCAQGRDFALQRGKTLVNYDRQFILVAPTPFVPFCWQLPQAIGRD